MNKDILKRELDDLKINSDLYSLNGDLLPDRVILNNSYSDWEVFYLDERGLRNDVKHFNTEEEACHYILELFKDDKQVEEDYLR